MSSFVRNIQRTAKRETYFRGRGSKLGVHDKKANDLVARQAREDKRAAKAAFGGKEAN